MRFVAFFSHRALSNKLHWMVTNCINDTYKYFSITLCDINLAKDFYISSTIVASIQYPKLFLYVFLCVYHYAYEYWRHAVNSTANAIKPGALQHSRHRYSIDIKIRYSYISMVLITSNNHKKSHINKRAIRMSVCRW